MLSRHSLTALRDISMHEIFRHRIQEIVIGPERINPNIVVEEDRAIIEIGDEEEEESVNRSDVEEEEEGTDDGSEDEEEEQGSDEGSDVSSDSGSESGAEDGEGSQLNSSNEAFIEWRDKYWKVYEELLKSQQTFDSENNTIKLLAQALGNFDNLRRVRIDGFQDSKARARVPWSAPWGAKTIYHQMGWGTFLDARAGDIDFEDLLTDPSRSHNRQVQHHYTTVLEALNHIMERDDWYMDICMNRMRNQTCNVSESAIFDISSGGWQVCQRRIRNLSFTGIGDSRDTHWLKQMLSDCPNVESLAINDDNWIYPLGPATGRTLKDSA
jgi:hypothetical protein